jgi:hypothetical protein
LAPYRRGRRAHPTQLGQNWYRLTESDPVALLLQYLISFGNAMATNPITLVERVLVGSSAKVRKGTAAERIRTVFEVADRDWVFAQIVAQCMSLCTLRLKPSRLIARALRHIGGADW